MAQLKDKIEEADEREFEAKQTLNAKEAEIEQMEKEAAGIRRRIKLLKAQLDKTNELFEEKQEKCDHLGCKTASDEEMRKRMEECEMEGDEKIQFYEEALKEATVKEEENFRTLGDAERRLLKVDEDLKREIKRRRKLEDKIAEHEYTINSVNNQMSELEKYDEEASEREELSEEKAKFLADQLKEVIGRAEDAERNKSRLERALYDIDNEVQSFKDKTKSVMAEMEEITGICDDLDEV